jgi:hypothetical protein
MKTGFADAIRRYLADESGISAGIVALSIVFLAGLGGLSVDLGFAYSTRVKTQAATNAAALAGAYFIGSTLDPVPVATVYSAGQGDNNANGNGFLSSMVSGYPKLLCLKTYSTQIPCLGGTADYPSGGANAIRVMETGRSPTFFAGIFGISYIPVTATATALAHGGSGKPLDIAMIIDTTESMGQTDATCGLTASSTKVQCAESGIATLLLNMTASMAKVQLLTFPAFPNQSQGNVDWACPKTGNPTITHYWTEASGSTVLGSGVVYTVTPSLVNNYQNSGVPVTLNQNSNIVKAIGYNTTCTSGLQTPGGEGTYYAGAINAAQAVLAADGDNPLAVQQVIILLSDGEANSPDNTIVNIPVTKGGSGYNAAPTVTISAPESNDGAIQATATANMSGTGSNQTVSSVTITNGGGGYTYVTGTGTPSPTVTFTTKSGKTGSGAAATVTLGSIPGVNQCAQAVTAANAAKAAGTEIFVIAYGSSTTASDCSTDYSPTITPCNALADIASDTTAADSVAYFYSDSYGGVLCPTATSVTNLATAGAEIAEILSKVRLVPNNTT